MTWLGSVALQETDHRLQARCCLAWARHFCKLMVDKLEELVTSLLDIIACKHFLPEIHVPLRWALHLSPRRWSRHWQTGR